MNRLNTALIHIVPRSPRGVVQVTLVALGTIVILGSLAMAGLLFITMPSSESGFAEGLAILVFGLYTLVGFIILAAGLLIPQRSDDGIHFTRTQRTLLAYGMLVPIVSVLAIPIGTTLLPPLSSGLTSLLVYGLAVLIMSGPLAILLTIGMKLHQYIVER